MFGFGRRCCTAIIALVLICIAWWLAITTTSGFLTGRNYLEPDASEIEPYTRAIAVFMDREPFFIDQLKWLTYSMNCTGVYRNTDILVFHHSNLNPSYALPDFCIQNITDLAKYQAAVAKLNRIELSKLRATLNSNSAPATANGTLVMNATALSEARDSNQTAAWSLLETANNTLIPSSVLRCFAIPTPLPSSITLQSYTYINSIYFLTTDFAEKILQNYDYILKSDMDVVFTPMFRNWFPTKLQLGIGRYVHSENVHFHLLNVSQKLNLTHQSRHNLGATWMGPSDLIIQIAKLTLRAVNYILENEFKSGPGKWPEWYRGVSSMYASEIAINHLVPQDEWEISTELDGPNEKDYTCRHRHLHAWHSYTGFNKFAYFEGKYNGLNVDGYTRTDLRNAERYWEYISLKSTKKDSHKGKRHRDLEDLCEYDL